MNLFYSPDLAPLFTLDAEESRHAVRVLRLRAGDELCVTDGMGRLARCRVVAPDERACTVETVRIDTQAAPQAALTLAVAPTKNPSRMEWLVEKAVEVGVDAIALLQCDRSERSFLKTDRLERLAVSAMKQSLHTRLPRINPAVPVSDWLSAFGPRPSILKLIAHCEAGQPRTPLGASLQPGRDAVVLIGPEGDFSEAEIALALGHGFRPVSLGPSRLRTETAALYAAVAFNLINDR